MGLDSTIGSLIGSVSSKDCFAGCVFSFICGSDCIRCRSCSLCRRSLCCEFCRISVTSRCISRSRSVNSILCCLNYIIISSLDKFKTYLYAPVSSINTNCKQANKGLRQWQFTDFLFLNHKLFPNQYKFHHLPHTQYVRHLPMLGYIQFHSPGTK